MKSRILWSVLAVAVICWNLAAADAHPKEYYRYYDSSVKLLPLSDKGIAGKDVKFRHPDLIKDGIVPEAVFAIPDSSKVTTAMRRVIPLEVFNDNPAAGVVHARFGVPFPAGVMYNFKNMRVTDTSGREIPFQSAVTAWYPDHSIKWALVQFDADIATMNKKIFRIEFGQQVTAPVFSSPLRWQENDENITVDTGVLKAVISKKRFNLLEKVSLKGKDIGGFSPEGLVFCDEKGEKHSSTASIPEKVEVIESGPVRLTVKVSGKLGSANRAGSYVVRLYFYANSAETGMDITYLNTALVNEFNDFSSLNCRFIPSAEVKKLTMDKVSASKFFQHNDKKLQIDTEFSTGKLSGGGVLDLSDNGRFTFALKDAALRYPKAFSIDGKAFDIALLPEQPDKNFNQDLPHYLRFPFCQGKYRMKWGMSFTETLRIDFSGKLDPVLLAGKDTVTTVNRDHIAGTKVFRGVPLGTKRTFDPWDRMAQAAFYNHMKIKEEQREYGFLNYGDWFGERGRNWTNNEYDLAHGLFMLYMRLGDREIFRWAMRAAEHQADVDIIHAYPDPFYFGCNAQHGVGHTGMSCHLVTHSSWALPLDSTFIGTNGHTWCDGMIEAWVLTGNDRCMDSSLKLGEHLVRYTGPMFNTLGTHERSAGWSLKALAALYNVTADKRYLDASRQIAAVAVKEQKPQMGGAWPHKLPRGHIGKTKETPGNAPFLIGTLLCGLRAYYDISGDPAIPPVIANGSRWMRTSFNQNLLAWPYTASWKGEPNFTPHSSLNLLVAPAMLCDNSTESYLIAKKVMAEATMRGVIPVGKSFAMRLALIDYLMESFFEYERKHPGEGAYDFVRELNEWHRTFPEQKFRIRFPEVKEFHVVLDGESASIAVDREKYGSRPKSKPEFKVTILDPSGRTVAADKGKTAEAYQRQFAIKGKKGDVFKVIIHDDMTGIWSVKTAGGKSFAKLNEQSSIAHNNPYPSIYYLTIPANTDKFIVTAESPNDFGLWIIDPAGKPAGFVVGVSPKHLKNAPKRYARHVKVAKSSKAQRYQIIVWNPSHMFLKISGFDPMISVEAQTYQP